MSALSRPPGTDPPAHERLWRSCAGALRTHAADLVVAFAVVFFATTYRVVRLEPIEIGGDALNKWNFARQWFHEFHVTKVPWDHHLTRFGVNLPLGLLQLVLGRAATNYHVAAVLSSTLVALLVYLAGRLAVGRTAGVIAAVWAVAFPSWVRAGAQITPDAYGAMWAALALVCLLVYASAPERSRGWLIASAFASFFSYFAKEPLAFFIPGAIVAAFLVGRRLWDTAIYAAVPLVLLGCETIFYRAVSDYSSRLAIVSSTHGKRPNVVSSIFGVFGRYADLPAYWYWLLVPALVGALGLPFLTKNRRVWAIICFPASFYFAYTFAIRGIHPIRMWTRFLPRYLDAGVPFCALVVGCLIGVLAEKLVGLAHGAKPSLVERARPLEPWLLAGGLACLSLAAYVRYPPSASHPLRRTHEYAEILTDAYRRGVPIVAPDAGPMGYKALKSAYSVYIDDRLLPTKGVLLEYADAHEPDERRLVRPGAPAFPPKCVVRVTTRDRFAVVTPPRARECQ